MALSPTEIKQQIDEKLAYLRTLHDDPNSEISPATRDLLKKSLYEKNLLRRPTAPVSSENLFPLSHEATKAMEDVYSGKFAPIDLQHPFISAGQKLREVAGALPMISQPVAGALDAMALPIRTVGRPAIESMQGVDPQLNFIEKAARSLTSDRDIGNVAARRTAADAPAIVQKYIEQGMSPQEAANRMQGDVTRNWMLGGAAENIMNLADPIALFKGMGAVSKIAKGKPKALPAGTPATIPGMDSLKNPFENIPQAPVDPALKEIKVKPVPQYFDPETGPSPDAPAWMFRDPEQGFGGGSMGLPKTTPPAPKPVVPNEPLPGLPTQFTNPNDPALLDHLAQFFPPQLVAKAPAELRLRVGNMSPNELRDFVGQLQHEAQLGGNEPNIIQQSAQEPVLPKQPPQGPVSPFTPGAGGQMFMKDQGKNVREFPSMERPAPVYDQPIGPARDQGQQQFDFTQGPAAPVVQPPAVKAPVQQLSVQALRAKLKDPNLSDEEFAFVQNQIQQKLNESKVINVDPVEARRLAEIENKKKLPKVVSTPVVEKVIKKEKVVKEAPLSAEEKVLHDRRKALLERAGDWTDADEAEYNLINRQLTELKKSKKSPSALEDIMTIVTGIKPTKGGLHSGIPLGPTELTDEAKAAVERWKTEHGPAVLAAAKAAGKDVNTFLKERFPTLTEAQLQEMSKAVGSVPSPAVAKNVSSSEVPVTTKDGRGQYKGKINLSVYSNPEVAGKIMDIIDTHPQIAQGLKITDAEVQKMATDISMGDKIAYLWKQIQKSPTGVLRAEVRAEGQQIASKLESLLKTDFGKDITTLKEVMDNVAETLKKRRQGISEIGGTLREAGLPIESQKILAKQFDEAISKYKSDPKAVGALKTLKKTLLDKEFNPTLWDKAYYIWINGLLSGPKTQFINTASNTLHMLGKFPDRALESLVDIPVSWFSKKRSTTLNEIPQMAKALVSKNEIPEKFRYNADGKTMENSNNISPLQGPVSKKFEPLMYGTKILAKTDEYFGNKVAQMEYEALKGKNLSDIEIQNLVQDEATTRTLTRAPASVTKVLLFAKQNLPGFRWIAPFIRTSADIIGQAAEHTPIGLYGIRKSMKEGTLTQRELVQRTSRLVKGTVFGVWAYNEWKKGNLVGDAPTDPKARTHFLETQHKQPNSVKINNTWVPLSTIEPLGSAMSIFVNFFEGMDKNYKDSKSAANAFLGGVMKAGVALGSKRYLQGAATAVKAASDPEQGGVKLAGQIVAGFVPGNVKTITDTMDTTQREAKTIPDMIKRRIPGASKTLPPVIDTFGKPVQKSSGLDLFSTKDARLSPEEKLVKDTPLTTPSTRINGEKISPQDQVFLEKRAGQIKKNLILQYQNKLSSMAQDRKQYLVDQISSQANQQARMELIKKTGKYRPKAPFK